VNMSKQSLFAASALALAICTAFAQPASAPAQSPGSVEVIGLKPAPIEDYVKPAQFSRPNLSPDGRYLAVSGALARQDEPRDRRPADAQGDGDHQRRRLRHPRRPLGRQRPPRVQPRPDQHADRPEQFDGGGLFMVSRDGKEFKKLAPTVREQIDSNVKPSGGWTSCRPIPATTNEILVTGQPAQPGLAGRLPPRPAQRPDHAVTGDRPRYAEAGSSTTRACRASSWRDRGHADDGRLLPQPADAPWKEIARNERGSGTALSRSASSPTTRR
jgi:hypothetical protein